MKISKQEMDAIARKLVDQGKLIESGWLSLKFMSIPEDAPQVQIDEMRNAFFAGAQHLYGSVMGMMEDGAEPTMNDLRRMAAIDAELTQFIEQFKTKFTKAGGAS